jgi:hypothetical protein
VNGIAPNVALFVQHGTVGGWGLTVPARYLTTGFAAPDPSPSRRLPGSCHRMPGPDHHAAARRGAEPSPAALDRLRAMDQALRDQHEDRHRVNALLAFIADVVEDYADRPTGQKP